MDLTTVWRLAKGIHRYDDFRDEINKRLTGTPSTVASDNEFELIVKNK